jgi:signal transduction histidine kinase/PAS domain-containing protein
MTINTGLFERAPEVSPVRQPLSPGRILINLAVLIFLAEMISMTVLYFLDLSNYLLATLADGLLMILLILPALYYLQLKPLKTQMEERSRAEQALRINERLLRTVLELLPVGVWITDPSGKIVHGNAASRNIWGGARYVGREKYGEYKGWWVSTGKRIKPDEWAVIRTIQRGESLLGEEVEIEAFDGSHKVILNSSVPILDDDNQIQGAIVVNQDLTLFRQVERDLIKTAELMERYFKSTYTLIAYLDLDFNFIRVNDTYARAGGHPEEYFIGKNHFELYPHAENLALFRQVVETGEPFSIAEKSFEYPDHPEWGVTYWDWGLQPVKGVDGAVEGLVLSLVDATERVRARKLLEEQNQELWALSASESRQRLLAEGLVQATIAVNSSLELEGVLDAILEQIHRAIPFRAASIALIENGAVHIVRARSLPEKAHASHPVENPFPLESSPLFSGAHAARLPQFIRDTRELPGWLMKPGQEWVLSFAVTPLIAADQVIGFITLSSDQPGAYDQKISERLAAFAGPAALAIQNARLYRTESHSRFAAELLSSAVQALARALDLEQAANTVLDYIRDVVPSDTAGVLLFGNGLDPVPFIRRGYGPWEGEENIPAFSLEAITSTPLWETLSMGGSCTAAGHFMQGTAGEEIPCRWLLAPVTASGKVIGLVELGRAGEDEYEPGATRLVEALAAQAAVAIQNSWLFQQVRSSNERLQSLARNLVEVQENERAYIARELHDEAGQVLSSLKLSLGRLEQDPECPPAIRERLQALKDDTDCVLEDLHRLAMNLRPAVLDHLGLVAALKQYIGDVKTDQLSVQFKALGFEERRLRADLETSLYRIVQEALTNVVRHSSASSVAVFMKWDGGKVKVFIEDDGIGFSQDPDDFKDRIGLIGMRERVEMLGGTLTIESSAGKGTAIIVEVVDDDSGTHRG